MKNKINNWPSIKEIILRRYNVSESEAGQIANKIMDYYIFGQVIINNSGD